MVAFETLPRDLIDCAASSNAATNPRKSPTVLAPPEMRQYAKAIAPATASPATASRSGPHPGAGADSLHAQLENLLEVFVDAPCGVVLEPEGFDQARTGNLLREP